MKLLLLLIFGSSLFQGSPMEVSPYRPVPDGYVLGRGDSVAVDIYGASQLQLKEVINMREQITVPGYGPVRIGGMSLSDAQRRLKQSLSGRYSESEVVLSLVSPRKISIKVSGEVRSPGEYLLHGYSHPLIALQAAGGIMPYGSLRRIEIIRHGTVKEIDLYDYLMHGAPSADNGAPLTEMLLQDGDEIHAGSYLKHVTIDGFVKRGGTYELKEGQTLEDLVGYSNGVTDSEIQIRIQHCSGSAVTQEIIGMQDISTYIPREKDTIVVEKIPYRSDEVVTVYGHVKKDGMFRICPEMNCLSKLLRVIEPIASDRKTDVLIYRDTTLLHRGEEEYSFTGRERVIVPYQAVEVQGEVAHPVLVDYIEGMTISDCISAAGGYTRKALRRKVFVIGLDGITRPANKATLLPGSIIVVPRK